MWKWECAISCDIQLNELVLNCAQFKCNIINSKFESIRLKKKIHQRKRKEYTKFTLWMHPHKIRVFFLLCVASAFFSCDTFHNPIFFRGDFQAALSILLAHSAAATSISVCTTHSDSEWMNSKSQNASECVYLVQFTVTRNTGR